MGRNAGSSLSDNAQPDAVEISHRKKVQKINDRETVLPHDNVCENLLPQREHLRNIFGRADVNDTYRKAKNFIIEYKLFRVARYEELGDVRRLTICNLWRVERQPDASIRTLEFCLKTGVWEEVSALEYWPMMPFWPIEKIQSLYWWRTIIKQAIWKALNAAGYFDLPCRYTKGTSRGRMAAILFERYLGKSEKSLDSTSMMAGARALRAAFFQHFLDREVFSAILVIDYRRVTFPCYLKYAQYRSSLLKVASEHRNLLPLLPGINPREWGRNDLFSRKLWVRDGRKSTALDRQPFRGVEVFHGKEFCRSFEVAAAWHWLSKASSVIIRQWSGKDTSIITNLALANVRAKTPVYAYVRIIANDAHRLKRYGVSPRIQRLLRLFLTYCAKLWKDRGYAIVCEWLRYNNQSSLSNMLDYLDAEGFEQGFPDRNATWTSLMRRSEDWHHRIAIVRVEQERIQKIMKWNSLVPETVIDDIVFTPLNDSRALAIEGYEMEHCVRSYTYLCYRGNYRVYSVMEPDGSRSTLGFEIKGRKIICEQHRSKYNGVVSPAANQAGRQLVAAYQQALSEGLGKSARPARRPRQGEGREGYCGPKEGVQGVRAGLPP